MEALDDISRSKKNGWEVFDRNGVEFMHLEPKRDHMNIDLWMGPDSLEDARSSGIAKPHPFDADGAVRVRFERAEDLTTVARWVEQAHAHAPNREPTEQKVPSKRPRRAASNQARA